MNPERRARPFLESLALLLERRPEARSQIRSRLKVRFIGACYQHDLDDAQRMGLDSIVSFEPARPHQESIRALLESHLLLLMEQDSERGGLILPGKIFEYLRASRPVLGLIPPGAAWDLITELGIGICCRTGNTEAVADALGTYYDAFEQGGVPPTNVPDEVLSRYERRTLTAEMTAIFNSLVG